MTILCAASRPHVPPSGVDRDVKSTGRQRQGTHSRESKLRQEMHENEREREGRRRRRPRECVGQSLFEGGRGVGKRYWHRRDSDEDPHCLLTHSLAHSHTQKEKREEAERGLGTAVGAGRKCVRWWGKIADVNTTQNSIAQRSTA